MHNALAEANRKVDLMRSFVRAVGEKKVTAVVLSGGPGIGKTWETMKIMKELGVRVTRHKGHITPLVVYTTLYYNRNGVVIFDDCDSAFSEMRSLNILKAAADTEAESRLVSWESTTTKSPVTEFYFQGGIVILTNALLNSSPHYKAFLDRLFFIDVHMSLEERLARLREVALKESGVPPVLAAEVLEWVIANAGRFGEDVSLRTFFKAVRLARAFGAAWQDLAAAGMFKG